MSFRDQVEARLRAFKIDSSVLATVQRRAPHVRRGAGPALKAHYDSICREPAYREVLEAAGARHYTALFENGFDEAYLERLAELAQIEQACGMGARSRVTMALTILQEPPRSSRSPSRPARRLRTSPARLPPCRTPCAARSSASAP
jgi:hypothetical protein